MRRTRFEASLDKRRAMKQAEENGGIADSMDVRMNLLERVKSGEITLAESQKELAKIKRDAKKSGKLTRQQVYTRS